MFSKVITVNAVETVKLFPKRTENPNIVIAIAVGKRDVKASIMPLNLAEERINSNSLTLISLNYLWTNCSQA